MLQPASHHFTAAPNGATKGDSKWMKTGYWPQIPEVPIKGMISMNPDAGIFP